MPQKKKERKRITRKNARRKRKCQSKRSYSNWNDTIHALDLYIVKYQPRRKLSTYRCKFLIRYI